MPSSPSRRVVRVRSTAGLRDMVRPPNGYNGGGEFVVPTREPLSVGHEVEVEVSFGPMADEICVEGIVTDVQPRGDRPALVTIYVVKADLPRVRYILEVIDGGRTPTARRHRRVPAELDIRWWWGIQAYSERARGLSVGGTFIPGQDAPQLGFQTEVEIRTTSRFVPIRLPATVVWKGETAFGPGFGVQFRMTDAKRADRLRDLVRDFERSNKDVVSLSDR